jgi:hypothetical protein
VRRFDGGGLAQTTDHPPSATLAPFTSVAMLLDFAGHGKIERRLAVQSLTEPIVSKTGAEPAGRPSPEGRVEAIRELLHEYCATKIVRPLTVPLNATI